MLLGPDGAGPVLALLRPDLSIAERHLRLPTESGEEVPRDVAGWLRELVEDPRGTWRSSWLRACAVRAGAGLLETLDLGPASALGDPIIDEALRGPADEPGRGRSGVGSFEHLCRYADRRLSGAGLRVVDPFSNGPCVLPCCSGSLGGLMTTGTIKKVIADRGFGFITAEDEGILLPPRRPRLHAQLRSPYRR